MSGKIIHVDKFMGGEMTPQEAHRKFGIRKKCMCGRPGVATIRVLVELAELIKRQPEFVAQIAASNPNGPYVPTVPTKYGNMVMVSNVAVCENCRKDGEIAAAKGPSWCLVEINSGPKDSITVQVPRGMGL